MGVVHGPAKPFRLFQRFSLQLHAKGSSRDQRTLGLIAVSLVIVSVVDYVVVPWPYVATPLYGVPILIACLSLSPRAVGLTATVAVALDIMSSIIQRLPWLPASVDVSGLLIITCLAVLAARHREAAEAATQRLQTFMNFVAHELRTPLTTQWGYLQLIEASSQGTMPETERQALSAIEGATQLLRRLADDLVDRVGIERGQLTIQRASMDLVSLAQEIIGLQQQTTEACHLVLQAPAELRGEWDLTRLRQVLNNLVSNAIKYSPSGGEIHMCMASEGGQALIDVSDDGLGIDPERMRHLFQPYSRLHREQQIEGLGLGLYLCKAIVDRHGGHIWAESEPGVGSTFHVALPLTAA